jgi:hypothetical protein
VLWKTVYGHVDECECVCAGVVTVRTRARVYVHVRVYVCVRADLDGPPPVFIFDKVVCDKGKENLFVGALQRQLRIGRGGLHEGNIS